MTASSTTGRRSSPGQRTPGVTRMIVTGSTAASSRAALALARRYPGKLFATAGVHPHHAAEFGPDTAPQLVEIATHPEVVAIGECGLDYFRDFSPRPEQRRAFERQLSLARAMGKPVFLHQRDAHADFLAIVREHAAELAGGVAHCFTGDRARDGGLSRRLASTSASPDGSATSGVAMRCAPRWPGCRSIE